MPGNVVMIQDLSIIKRDLTNGAGVSLCHSKCCQALWRRAKELHMASVSALLAFALPAYSAVVAELVRFFVVPAAVASHLVVLKRCLIRADILFVLLARSH